jgi:UDP-glucose 4-epimerase
MHVVIFGATGNAGTSLIEALEQEPSVDRITGVARRLPTSPMPKTTWRRADIVDDDLEPLVRDADAVVHLAWLIQPSRSPRTLHAVNVEGSRRVFHAAAAAKVPALIYASSVGAYSLGPKDRPVDESWPTHGVATSFYGRHKAATERMLDVFEAAHPEMRIVRLRPGLIFKGSSATEQRRLFAGPFLPGSLVRPRLIPVIPDIPRLRFQCVHSLDIGQAYRLAITSQVRGAFNVAADPVLGPSELAEVFGAKLVPLRTKTLYSLWSLGYRSRLHPTPAGWLDLALQTPIMSTERARTELGWSPRFSSVDALLELMAGMRGGDGHVTPPLQRDSLAMRAREVRMGVGRANLY